MEEDQGFLEFVVKGLVDHPEEVKVSRSVDEMGVLLTLDVNAEDMGKIIGRSGNTAKAIRTLLRVVGMKNNSRVNLKINEPVGGLRSPEMMAAAGDTAGGDAPAAPAAEEPQNNEVQKSLDEAMADLKI